MSSKILEKTKHYLSFIEEYFPSAYESTLKNLKFDSDLADKFYNQKLYRISYIKEAIAKEGKYKDINLSTLPFKDLNKELKTLCLSFTKLNLSNVEFFNDNGRKFNLYKDKNVLIKTLKKMKTNYKISSTDKGALIKTIKNRTDDECCICISIKEMMKIGKASFISLMKTNFKKICNKDLSSSRITSWNDEYDNIVNKFAPVFYRLNKKALDYKIVFELKLPSSRSNPSSGDYIYSDAVIFGTNGFVVLEFKQRDFKCVESFRTEAMKYTSRLRYRKDRAIQKYRYTYIVPTKEEQSYVSYSVNNPHLKYGDPINVTGDIILHFINNNKPVKDIKKHLNVGYYAKRD